MLYDLIKFKQLLASGDWCYMNTRVPLRTLENLEWKDDVQLKALLVSLSVKDFQKTVRNCRVTNVLGCELVDADQYEIHWNEIKQAREVKWSKEINSFSLKIAIVTDAQGQKAGLVTFHLSGAI